MADWYSGNPYAHEFGIRFFPYSASIYRPNGNYSSLSFTSFSGKNKAWHLYPVGRLEVEPPDVDIKLVDVPGGDIPIDLTDVLIGRPVYKSRKAEWVFKIVADRSMWDTIYADIMNTLHGRRFKVVRQEEPYYYYEGRFKIVSTKSDKYNGRVRMQAVFEPWKRTVQTSHDDWLWDPFSFEDGYIYFPGDSNENPNDYSVSWAATECWDNYGVTALEGDEMQTLYITNPTSMPLSPKFTVTLKPVHIECGSYSYDWDVGDHYMPEVEWQGNQTKPVKVRLGDDIESGVAGLAVEFRGGSL